DKALIQLSTRYRTEDHFWFTLFHEAAHVLLHCRGQIILDSEGDQTAKIEEEANLFARRCLLKDSDFARLKELPKTYEAVIRFARSAGVSAGLVVGQMQKAGFIPFNMLNKVKRDLNWDFQGA